MKTLVSGQHLKTAKWNMSVEFGDTIYDKPCLHTSHHGILITSDVEYNKQRDELRKENFKNAIRVEDGEVVLINDKEYTIKVLDEGKTRPSYSDPIHFLPVEKCNFT